LIEHCAALQRRRDIVVDAPNAVDGATCRRAEGALYTSASSPGLIGRRTADGTTIDTNSTFCSYPSGEA
jgi:aspartate aminotransferase